MVEDKLGCPFCNGKNIQYYIGFRYCKDCKREYDYSDYDDYKNASRVSYIEMELDTAEKEAKKDG